MRTYILELWDDLAAIALQGCPTELRGEFKKTFFAGAAGLFKVICESTTTQTFDAIQHELLDYHQTLKHIDAMREAPPPDGKPPVDVQRMRELEKMARDAFRSLDTSLGGVLDRREIGAALFLFSFLGAELTYIANADRADMLKLLHEFLAANPPAMTWDEQHG